MALPQRYAKPRARVNRAPNKLTDLSNPTVPRTGTAGKGQQKSKKTDVQIHHDVKDTLRPKAKKVGAGTLNTTPKTPFNQNRRSTRVNYRQLKKRNG